MSNSQTVQGTIQTDGSLLLAENLRLPPGPVRVTLELSAVVQAHEDSSTVLQRIWAEREALGMPSRTKEEIDADLQATRDEWEEHQQGLERIQDEARRAREQRPC